MKLFASAAAPANDSVRAFRAAAERHIDELFERFPTSASGEGLEEFNAGLERPDAATYEKHAKALRRTLTAVQDLPESDFVGDDWLDRRAFLADLRTSLWSVERETHRRNPDAWATGALDAVHSLVAKRADDLSPVVDAVLARMKKLPDYLERAASLLKNPVPLWQDLALQSCDAAPGFFDALSEPLTRTGKATPAKVSALIAGVKAAFKNYQKHVDKLRPGRPNDFAVGRDRFEAIIRERLGWDLTVEEARALGKSLAARLKDEMDVEARRLAPGKKPRQILEDAAADWNPSQGDLLNEYRHQTTRVREAFEKAGLVSFTGPESLLVKPVPDFLRHHFPTAAYHSPGSFEKEQTGIFWVNDLSLVRDTAKEKDAEVRQHFGLEATCAHEAYPGHHLQFCANNRHPSGLRRLFKHAIFYEGWTLWCEQMSVEFGIIQEPTAKLNQLHDALWRAHRILIDIGLQTGEMSYDDAVKHLVKHVGFTKGRAQADVNWYTSAPTVPMSYLLGRTELLRVKKKKVDQGGWTVRQFNDWALSFGTLPWRWMEHSGL